MGNIPKNDLKLRLNGGIGDVILARNLLDSIKSSYKSITITPHNDILNKYREGSSEYLEFLMSFMKMIFNGSPYVVGSDKNYGRFSIMDNLLNGLRISNNGMYCINDYSHLFCDDINVPFDKDYIAITTKVRGTPIYSNYYKQYKNVFLDTLKKISNKYAIILLGERKILPSFEYNIIGKERIYCIYDDIMNKISDRCIDLTISGEEAKQPSINKIKEDCAIMRKSKSVITFGFGGNLILALATAKRGLFFLGEEKDPQNVYYTKMSQHKQREGIEVLKDFNIFINHMENI